MRDIASRTVFRIAIFIGKNNLQAVSDRQKIPQSLVWRALQPETLCYRAPRVIRPQCPSTVSTRMWLGA
ncbi:MAG TPA: hypothetical protein VEI25_16785 [Paraburkholderia sp.]|nr:hypothetical protein [Paraburkholderia sp.]